MDLVKVRYFLRSTGKALLGRGSGCPSCGGAAAETVDRKYTVTRLVRCGRCELLYRAPTTGTVESTAFYQEEYEQGFTTELPDDARLAELLRNGFRDTEKDYGGYLAVLEALGGRPGHLLLDFGCSWGYGSWQFTRAGYHVKAFEISQPRCRFAREKLGLDAVSRLEEVGDGFDVVFSAHVLEHVPSVEEAVAFGLNALRPGGIWVAFTPNGCASYRAVNPYCWHLSWGYVHPQLLDDVYCRRRFADKPYAIASNPYDRQALSAWDGAGQVVLGLEGSELLVAVRKRETR